MKFFFIVLCLLLGSSVFSQNTLFGDWDLLKDSSDPVMYYSGCELTISKESNSILLNWRWIDKFGFTDSVRLDIAGTPFRYRQTNRVWPNQNFIGFKNDTSKINTAWLRSYTPFSLKLERNDNLISSQGPFLASTIQSFKLSKDGNLMTVLAKRNFRKENVKYVFHRNSHNIVFSYNIKPNWKLNGGVDENALLISLQGIVNRNKATLYCVYPPGWEYRFTKPIKDFYSLDKGYTFTSLNSMKDVLHMFKDSVKGYVVWDTASRNSLCIAYTLAGLKDAIVVSANQIVLAENMGLHMIEDFRGKFNHMSDADAFRWALAHYWKDCDKDFLLWLGGVDKDEIMPAIADFGVSKKSFFVDISTDPDDKDEYALSDSIMSLMNPLAIVIGWHSYAKDLERQYVTLCSKHGIRVEGLNTFPNLSFTNKTPPSPGFKYKNNRTTGPIPKAKPNMTYITCIQTDGLGLGAWERPGRGSIPYAWEVTLNWEWMCPVLLEYHYKTSSKNDLFIGALSGPGYMYPKAIPDSLFGPLMHVADTLCKTLDIDVFETMDYSEGSAAMGNNDITQKVVRNYFKAMPDIVGIYNGYAPSYSYGLVEKKPFISFEYYMDEHLPEKKVVEDLWELIQTNQKRPYFLAIHVREWNDIDRVKRIIDQLGSHVEILPADTFIKMAGQNWSFKDYFLKDKNRLNK